MTVFRRRQKFYCQSSTNLASIIFIYIARFVAIAHSHVQWDKNALNQLIKLALFHLCRSLTMANKNFIMSEIHCPPAGWEQLIRPWSLPTPPFHTKWRLMELKLSPAWRWVVRLKNQVRNGPKLPGFSHWLLLFNLYYIVTAIVKCFMTFWYILLINCTIIQKMHDLRKGLSIYQATC